MRQLNEYLTIATEAANAAGNVLQKYWGNLSSIVEKQPGDLVTEADKEAEKTIIDIITKNFPDHEILSEEFGFHQREGATFKWVIDPLDGTTNYTHKYPQVCVSIALFSNNQPIIGVIYNPFLNELFQAAKGCGATLNNKKIQVSKVSQLSKSLLASGFPYDRRENPDNNYTEFCHLTHLTQGVRRGGSAALDLAYVAAGRFDGYWEKGIKPWDIAAGVLMVQEAGGQVSSYDSFPLDWTQERVLASNGLVHRAISTELLSCRVSTQST